VTSGTAPSVASRSHDTQTEVSPAAFAPATSEASESPTWTASCGSTPRPESARSNGSVSGFTAESGVAKTVAVERVGDAERLEFRLLALPTPVRDETEPVVVVEGVERRPRTGAESDVRVVRFLVGVRESGSDGRVAPLLLGDGSEHLLPEVERTLAVHLRDPARHVVGREEGLYVCGGERLREAVGLGARVLTERVVEVEEDGRHLVSHVAARSVRVMKVRVFGGRRWCPRAFGIETRFGHRFRRRNR